jgi:hypothetical protein
MLEFAFRKMHTLENRTLENRKERRRTLQEALLDTLRRYEELRAAGRHDGPPLQSVRLYIVRWQLDAQAANLNRPDYRRLIAEVERRPR